MQFNVPVVKKCLIDNHEVYTVRSYKSFDKFRAVDVDGVDYLCERMNVVKCVEDLEDFVKLSGFKSALDWWNKIRSFSAVGGHMYYVSLL